MLASPESLRLARAERQLDLLLAAVCRVLDTDAPQEVWECSFEELRTLVDRLVDERIKP